MSTLAHDFRVARRQLTKSPLFTTIVVATLALAIGLNTAVFSALDALLLRPLPGVRDPQQIVQLYRSWPGGINYGSSSIPHYNDLHDRTADAYSGVALWAFTPLNISATGTPHRVMGSLASANFFSTLGVVPAKGRFFVPAEDTGRLAHRVTVLSWSSWQTLFGGDENIIGKHAVVNGGDYEIVGVAPRDFKGIMPIITPALWVPLTQLEEARPGSGFQWTARGNNSFSVIARLKPGVTVEQARGRMDALVTQLRAEHPDDYKQSGISVIPQSEAGIHPMIKGAEVGLSAAVMAVVAILLLVACLNVANLFLARARDRAREMAVRLSIGATRRSLIRQLLIESLAFAAVSALVGLGIAQWAITVANRITLPIDFDFSAGLTLSPTVLAFTVVVSVVAALLFGIAPALQATNPSLVPALKGEAPAGESRSRVRNGLIVAQMALSIVLLVSAGLFLRNLKAASAADKGFNSANLLVADMDPGMQGYTRARAEAFYRDLTARLTSHPGVQAVGYAQWLPLSANESDTAPEIPGYTPGPNENMGVQYGIVDPGYFPAMGIPVTAGRAFQVSDDSASQRVMVVNQEFVRKYLGGHDALSTTIRVGGKEYAIVGVVPTGKYFRLGEPPTPFMYFAQAQRFDAGLSVVIRTTVPPETLMPALRQDVAALDPTLPLANVKTMDQFLGFALLPARLSGVVLGVFGMLGLVLAAIGVYGVMAYSVAQRTREIGIRMAIGAAASDVVGLVMKQGLRLVTIGAAIGLVAAFGASRALASVLYGGGQNDVATFVTVPLVLLATAMLATWAPARRAAATDPLAALRQE
ncbi:MAG TPA: ABC transporter permease [Gemmatimonadaceae bacterium]|nr:ABC transporter permease [Gemmatimonadaceae bacterium]